MQITNILYNLVNVNLTMMFHKIAVFGFNPNFICIYILILLCNVLD